MGKPKRSAGRTTEHEKKAPKARKAERHEARIARLRARTEALVGQEVMVREKGGTFRAKVEGMAARPEGARPGSYLRVVMPLCEPKVVSRRRIKRERKPD
jgi:hypothetical protein